MLASGSQPDPAKAEAARKLIKNHAMVLADVTNPSPLTQQELTRVRPEYAAHGDQALREVARRLAGPSRRGAPDRAARERLRASDCPCGGTSNACRAMCAVGFF